MKKKHRIALILFAIVDIVIIAFLARTVYKTWATYSGYSEQSPQSHCASIFLDTLQAGDRQVTFSQQDDAIFLTVIYRTVEIMDEQDDAELLWSLLDQLALIMHNAYEICQEPESLVIQLDVQRKNTIMNHAAIVQINDLIFWSKGEIDSHTFAANIKYRQTTASSD